MSSGKSSPEQSSDRVAENPALLAQPESSDSVMETSFEKGSTASLEQKTDSSVVFPTPDASTSGYVGEPLSESGRGLSALPQDESAATDLSEAGSGSTVASPTRGESQSDTAKELPSTSAPDEVKSQTEEAKGQLGSPAECLLSTSASTSSLKSPVLSAASSPSEAHEKSGVDSNAKWESLPSTSQDLSPFEQPSDNESELLVAPNGEQDETGRWVGPKPPRRSIPPRIYFRPRLVNRNQYTGLRGSIVYFLQTWQTYSISFTDSIFLVPFQIILITLSVSAVTMGALNLYNCPMAEEIPWLVIALGVVGFLAITLRIVFVFYYLFSLTLSCVNFQRNMIAFLTVAFLILFSGELYNFFTYTPSFDVNSPNYCNPVFHTYSLILNFAVLFLVTLLFALHCPAYLFYHFHVGGPGIPVTDEE